MVEISTPKLLYTSNTLLQRQLAGHSLSAPASVDGNLSDSSSTSLQAPSVSSISSVQTYSTFPKASHKSYTNYDVRKVVRNRDNFYMKDIYYGKPITRIEAIKPVGPKVNWFAKHGIGKARISRCNIDLHDYHIDDQLVSVGKSEIELIKYSCVEE